ncbi:MAG: hypothetical protein IKF06_09790, partial [Lachnospiraceae bacterium]|nr:hypothetical protein [Lachnospiraceae bacterium]
CPLSSSKVIVFYAHNYTNKIHILQHNTGHFSAERQFFLELSAKTGLILFIFQSTKKAAD